MTRSVNPSLLLELQNPPNSAAQLAALRTLKNELIGHELKKRTWIGYGIIPVLLNILSSKRAQNGKRANRDASGNGSIHHGRAAVSNGDSSSLQATIIVGTLAQGEL